MSIRTATRKPFRDGIRPFGAFATLLAGLILPASAAGKVVMLYDAWPGTPPPLRIIGGWDGSSWRGPETSAGDMALQGRWFVKNLPSTWSPTAGTNDIAFATPDWKTKYGNRGIGDQSDIDVAPVLSTSDTVWIVPDPLPGGPPKLLGKRPPQKTLMFLEPWSGPGWVQLDGGAWTRLEPSGDPGWSCAFVLEWSSPSLLFRSADSAIRFGAAGPSPLPIPFATDSVSTGDTLWIRPLWDTAGPPSLSSSRPSGRTVMLFDPWAGRAPIRRPAIEWGASAQPMFPSAERCGWYSREAWGRPPLVRFGNASGATLGRTGFGSPDPIDLSAAFAGGDTAWIVADPATGVPSVRPRFTGETGPCSRSLLAATIRDFDTTHPDFEKGWAGVVKKMVMPTLDADRKPVKNPLVHFVTAGGKHVGDTVDTRLEVDWFRNSSYNVETCRDIPLSLDTATGSYVYDDPNYFPVDDFRTLPDGTANPRLNMMTGNDGKTHNFSFCLESHGEFDFRKGQTFRFRGDDDVWFFIDGHLVVDVGGVHGPSRDSVRLSDIGWKFVKRNVDGVAMIDTVRDTTRTPLVEGRTYPFDFFFCERYAGGSSILIQTDMNMRTRSGFLAKDSVLAPGRISHGLWISQTSGQGCKARDDIAPTTGRFSLVGPGLPVPVAIAAGTTAFCGIAIDPLGMGATIDSARLCGLAPGSYTLTATSLLDTNATVRIPFDVPWTTYPRFVGIRPLVSSTPGVLELRVGSFDARGPDSSSLAFVLRPAAGMRFYADSALARELGAADTLRTGAGGVPRRVWVRGDEPGVRSATTGRWPGDSTDTHPDILFLAPRPHHRLRSPWTGTVGSTVRLEIVSIDELGAAPLGARFRVRRAPGLGLWLDSLRTIPLDTTPFLRVPDGGVLPLWASASTPGTWSVELLDPEGETVDTREGLSFLDKGLRFVDAEGVPVSPAAWIGRPGDTVRLRFETFAGTGRCGECGDVVSVSTTVSGIHLLDPSGRPVDSALLTDGRGEILVRAESPFEDAALLVALASDPTLRAVWSPLAARAAAPLGGSIHDDDGDGRPDRMRLAPGQAWKPSQRAWASWPSSTDSIGSRGQESAGDSVDVRLAEAGEATAPGPGATGWWSWDSGSAPQPFVLRDGVPAKVRRAVLGRGAAGAPDTLRVVLTESVSMASPHGALQVLGSGAWNRLDPIAATSTGSRLEFLLPPGGSIHRGDSVRTAPGSTTDSSGNTPLENALGAPVEAAGLPPARGTLLDDDGDGAPDRVRIEFEEDVDTAAAGAFEFEFATADGALLSRRGLRPRPVAGDPRHLSIPLESPLPRGATAFSRITGICIRDDLPGIDAPLSRVDGFPVDDGASPLLVAATLLPAADFDDPDTLVLRSSEPIRSDSWTLLDKRGNDVSGASTVDGEERAEGTELVVLLDGKDPWIRVGDSLRWTPEGTVRDTAGNLARDDAPFAVAIGVPRVARLRVTPPRSMTRIPGDAAEGSHRPGIQLSTVADGTRRTIDASGSPTPSSTPCPESRCTGPDLDIDGPVRVALVVLDRIGTFVAGWEGGIDAEAFGRLDAERPGRARVSLRWDLSDQAGRPVADGVYLMRLVVRGDDDAPINHVWVLGVRDEHR